ncbi:PTS system, mannitol-specific IIB component/PTS system, mannitol-specific IIC component [Nonomuraea maritima]|uniref:PTS system, mannitol-specific IIB component/PTS system, mannitol-specific IIC component n=1 Tax=Nonomuraea maritima TaxID=683260 RepID=A0A1G9PXJ8_9ACTN|nr:PTS lactose transporter subunit IIB [Nonomuraea maritima]SDM03498.1 PTS system, mannitol-specific IIB component/PTS system, mannitol-specific IIC component [Nonomuraea maritima]
MAGIDSKDIRKIIVACDAGMGSSVMLASQLKKQLKNTGVTVEHTPVDSIPADADIVVCHSGLAARARAAAPDKPLVPFQIFLGDPAVTKLVDAIKNGGTVDA